MFSLAVMSSVSPHVNSGLYSGVKFWGVKRYTEILAVQGIGVPNSHVLQGPAVLTANSAPNSSHTSSLWGLLFGLVFCIFIRWRNLSSEAF